MGFRCGIVGLPNVGKSTLFNALTEAAHAEASNYPFCTIEPNVGRVGVPDERLTKLAELASSAKVIPTQLEFVDIAGLVKGASKGEGLGNQFLGHIREVDAIVHVVRCFQNDDITHVDGSIDPLRDIETINTELMLADMESLEKRIPALEKKAKGNDVVAIRQIPLMRKVLDVLREGKPARLTAVQGDEAEELKAMQLITSKPVLYACNVNEDDAATGNEFTQRVDAMAKEEGARTVVISAEIEAQVSELEEETEKLEFLESLGLNETGLAHVIREGYKLLNLITFFTVGPKESHAWTVKQNSTAPEAAGEIHTDFEKGFIKADTISYEDFVACGGEHEAKNQGKMRQEGRDYVVHDGDVFHFKFNV